MFEKTENKRKIGHRRPFLSKVFRRKQCLISFGYFGRRDYSFGSDLLPPNVLLLLATSSSPGITIIVIMTLGIMTLVIMTLVTMALVIMTFKGPTCEHLFYSCRTRAAETLSATRWADGGIVIARVRKQGPSSQRRVGGSGHSPANRAWGVPQTVLFGCDSDSHLVLSPLGVLARGRAPTLR